MVAETEITVQVFETLDTVDKVLKNKGFKVRDRFELHDNYFTTLKNVDGLDFQTLIANSVLVRRLVREDKTEKYILTYKAKEFNLNGSVISENKVNVLVDDATKTAEILRLAGLKNWVNVDNYSIVYKRGDEELCFQDVKGVGLLVEVEENASMADLSPNEKIAALKAQIIATGFKLGNDFSCKKAMMAYINESERGKTL